MSSLKIQPEQQIPFLVAHLARVLRIWLMISQLDKMGKILSLSDRHALFYRVSLHEEAAKQMEGVLSKFLSELEW